MIHCSLPSPDSSSPCGLLYSPSHNSLWVLFRSGRFIQYQFQPDLTTGSYSLLLGQSVDLISTISHKKQSQIVTWEPYVTAVNERCFVYVTKEENEILLHFMELEYKTELSHLSLPELPTGISVIKSHLFVLNHGNVSYASLTLSNLSMCNLLRSSSNTQSLTSPCLHVDSTVHEAETLLKDLPVGLLGKREWSKRTHSAFDSSIEENDLLHETNSNRFEKACISFVTKRRLENHGVVSFDRRFLSQLIERCLLPDGQVLSNVLRQLLLCGSDIAINPHVLPTLIRTRDIDTLLLFLVRVPVVSVKDLLALLNFFMELPLEVVQSFAKRNQWPERSPIESKRVLLSIVGPQVLRVRCDVMDLRREVAALPMNDVYELGVLLLTLMIDLDNPHEEERLLLEQCECQIKRLYAPSLVEWLSAWVDGNMIKMVMETKTDDRFVK